jgi:hypothetical protein
MRRLLIYIFKPARTELNKRKIGDFYIIQNKMIYSSINVYAAIHKYLCIGKSFGYTYPMMTFRRSVYPTSEDYDGHNIDDRRLHIYLEIMSQGMSTKPPYLTCLVLFIDDNFNIFAVINGLCTKIDVGLENVQYLFNKIVLGRFHDIQNIIHSYVQHLNEN